jgi:hypothetical protein
MPSVCPGFARCADPGYEDCACLVAFIAMRMQPVRPVTGRVPAESQRSSNASPSSMAGKRSRCAASSLACSVVVTTTGSSVHSLTG